MAQPAIVSKVNWLNKWWSGVFVVPFLLFVVLLLHYKVFYPVLTYDTFPIRMNSFLAIKILVISAAIFMSFIVSYLYQLKSFLFLFIWVPLMIVGFFTIEPVDGNQNLGLIGHFSFYQILATAITIFSVSLYLKGKLVKP